MNVLFLEMELAPHLGGVQRVSYILARELVEYENVHTYFAYTAGDTDTIESGRKINLDINDKEQYKDKLSMFIREKSIDIVVCQNPYLLYYPDLYLELKKKYNIKFVCVFHANPERYNSVYSYNKYFKRLFLKEIVRNTLGRLLHSMYKKKIQEMYDVSDAFVLLSSTYIDAFKRIYGIEDSEKKLTAIFNPSSCHSEDNNVTKENTLLVVGRMEESQKRISLVLETWKKISNQLSDWSCCIVGDGPHLNVYKRIAESENLENINFVGHSNKVQDYYLKSKLFLMTSTWEGLPMVLIEAQNCECVPIAVNSFSSVTDVIEDGVNGIIVDKPNSDKIAHSILSVIDSGKIEAMARDSKLSVRNRFSIEKVTKDWMKLFNELINK